MTIKKALYKDVPAYILDTGTYLATVLPEDGGKIASFIKKSTGTEYLLTREGDTYGRIRMDDAFERGECSGFDDMFPTIDPEYIVNEAGEERFHPDHGEISRVALTPTENENSLTLTYTSESLGYRFEKTFTEDDGKLRISYKIENLKTPKMPALFAAHCLIRAEEGGKLLFPFGEGEEVDILFDSSERLPVGKRTEYKNSLAESVFYPPRCEKFYFPRECPLGFVGYEYPSGETFLMEFDREALSCLGIWQNFGGLNDCYCIGLEPASLGYDTVSEAKRRGQEKPIENGNPLSFFIALSVK